MQALRRGLACTHSQTVRSGEATWGSWSSRLRPPPCRIGLVVLIPGSDPGDGGSIPSSGATDTLGVLEDLSNQFEWNKAYRVVLVHECTTESANLASEFQVFSTSDEAAKTTAQVHFGLILTSLGHGANCTLRN